MLDLPRVDLHASVSSTLDVAHAIAADAPNGTLILADEQTSGRGRHGRRWSSPPGAGLWITLIERPTDARSLDVLALRCGLFAAEALDALASAPIGVKWPNDLFVGGRKLAGILIETRWRGTSAEWVAIGFGLNVASPEQEGATGLVSGTTRLGALARLVHGLVAGSRERAVGVDPTHLDGEHAAGLLDAVEERHRVPDRDLLQLARHVPAEGGVEQRARGGRLVREVGELHDAGGLDAGELPRRRCRPSAGLFLLPARSAGHGRSGLQVRGHA